MLLYYNYIYIYIKLFAFKFLVNYTKMLKKLFLSIHLYITTSFPQLIKDQKQNYDMCLRIVFSERIYEDIR